MKSGFLTGSTFGVNVFQAPYRNISSVDVDFGLMSGVFEIMTGGGLGKKKSYWGRSKDGTRAQEEPNCGSLLRNSSPDAFREASHFIMSLVNDVDQARFATPSAVGFSTADELRKLAELRRDGILTDDEFQAQQAGLMGRPGPQRIATKPAAIVPQEAEEDFSAADAAIRRALAQRLAEPLGGTSGQPGRSEFGRRSSRPR